MSARRKRGTTESGGNTALAIALAGAVQSFSCDAALLLVICRRAAALGGTAPPALGAAPGQRVGGAPGGVESLLAVRSGHEPVLLQRGLVLLAPPGHDAECFVQRGVCCVLSL